MSVKKRSKILLVDDVPENIHVLINILKKDFDLLAATNGEKAIELAKKNQDIDIILLDIMMPDLDGYEVCKILKSTEGTKKIPIIFITALGEAENEEKGLSLGAVDYIIKPINEYLVKQRVKNQIELKQYRDHLEELVELKTMQIKKSKEAVIEAMGIVAEKRDSETGHHIQRVKEYVKLIAIQLSTHDKYKPILTSQYIEDLYHSSPLHDIGKVAIKDNILLKKGKLTAQEFEDMKLHTIIGEETLDMVQNDLTQTVIAISKELAIAHHENWDGSGYPKGLKENNIPISARILSIADVYDAMLHKRVYKEALEKNEVVNKIKSQSGTKFDPDVVDAFLEVLPQFEEIEKKFAI